MFWPLQAAQAGQAAPEIRASWSLASDDVIGQMPRCTRTTWPQAVPTGPGSLAVAQPETGMAQAPAVSPTAMREVLEPLILLETAAGEAKAASPKTL